jgi:hypothetical protein
MSRERDDTDGFMFPFFDIFIVSDMGNEALMRGTSIYQWSKVGGGWWVGKLKCHGPGLPCELCM